MKLLIVLMLAALPLLCYAGSGSGCQLLDDVVEKTIDPEVSLSEYQQYLQEFLDSDADQEAVGEFKQCFLNQSNETLQNFDLMMKIIYDSPWCRAF
ncbi:mammaglobin-B-like [Hylobates moloch]|uniref:mammaglobin-B-like n=1 Tax=Hylobates moloch TaxID=81572 RepID=UPI001362534C|nr:mammaglobin-B-like [Hylobates moloch]